MGLNISFTGLVDLNGTLVEIETDQIPFLYSIPYVEEISIVEIRNATHRIEHRTSFCHSLSRETVTPVLNCGFIIAIV